MLKTEGKTVQEHAAANQSLRLQGELEARVEEIVRAAQDRIPRSVENE